MVNHRRKFLLTGTLGLFGASLMPGYFMRLTSTKNPLESFASTFSLKAQTISSLLIPSEYSGADRISSRIYEGIQGVYFGHAEQNALRAFTISEDGLRAMLHLDSWEVNAILDAARSLRNQENGMLTREISALLLPVRRNDLHRLPNACIASDDSSPFGYYTKNGFCQVRGHAAGNNMSVQVKLLNHDLSLSHDLQWNQRVS